FSFSATSLGTPARRPPSTSAFFTQSFRVWAEQPIFWETETTAAQREGYSPPCSSTNRTARVRTPGVNLFVVLLIRLYPIWELEPPTVPVRFTQCCRTAKKTGILMADRSGHQPAQDTEQLDFLEAVSRGGQLERTDTACSICLEADKDE